MAKTGNWMAGAVKRPGSLHRALGVPTSKKIPAGAIAKAANSRNANLARKANLAKTFAKFNR